MLIFLLGILAMYDIHCFAVICTPPPVDYLRMFKVTLFLWF